MRILLDTNVVISAALFPSSKTALAVAKAIREHTLLICTYVIEQQKAGF